MCISVLSTAHPDYPFVLISNRDEVINRPTARVDWWDPPHEDVLGGRDLQRHERGTWLGITRQGRIAILTNFRDGGVEINRDKSRGGITLSYLTVPPDTEEDDREFVERLMRDVGIHNVGGFTLLFGILRAPSLRASSYASTAQTLPGLGLVSNRTATADDLARIATSLGETHGLSNSHYGDLSWPKVVHGEMLLKQAIKANVDRQDSQETFIASLFDILNVDTLPRRRPDETREMYAGQMRNSILIHAPKGDLGEGQLPSDPRVVGEPAMDRATLALPHDSYGTQKQTIILVSQAGEVTFVERTLYDEQGLPMAANERDRTIQFDIDGWDECTGTQRQFDARL